jgi:hypothetical protein
MQNYKFRRATRGKIAGSNGQDETRIARGLKDKSQRLA